jgi:hypothetical protein
MLVSVQNVRRKMGEAMLTLQQSPTKSHTDVLSKGQANDDAGMSLPVSSQFPENEVSYALQLCSRSKVPHVLDPGCCRILEPQMPLVSSNNSYWTDAVQHTTRHYSPSRLCRCQDHVKTWASADTSELCKQTGH